MSGLFAAILLRRAGWEADIYERVDVGLIGRGAGIVTHAEMRAVLRAAGCDPSTDLGVDVTMRRTLDRSGAVAGDFVCPQTLTSWDRVFRMLRQEFPDARYHIGKELQRIEQTDDRVVAHFADGSAAEGDLLVGADGFRSNVRAEVLPEVKPVYAGYIAWRGLVDESALPPPVHADIFDAMVFGLPPNEQFISYPVAGRDNDLRPGHRRCNFVWYRPADEATELRRLLTDASGTLPRARHPAAAGARGGDRVVARGVAHAAGAAARRGGEPDAAAVPAADLRRRDRAHGGRPGRDHRRRRLPGAAACRRRRHQGGGGRDGARERAARARRCCRGARGLRARAHSGQSAHHASAAASSAAICSRICWRRRRSPPPNAITRRRRSCRRSRCWIFERLIRLSAQAGIARPSRLAVQTGCRDSAA